MKQIRFYRIITAVCCLLLMSCGIDKNLKKGEKFLALGEYYDAADQFKQAYTKTPSKERASRGKIALKMARCYDKINSTPKAIAAYRNAVRYNQASIDDRLAYARLLLKNGVMVVIEAKHMCMQMRGVEKQNSITTTSDYSGVFNSLNTRQEFMSLLRGESKRI